MSRALDWLRQLLRRPTRPVGPVGPLRPDPADPPVDPDDLQAAKLRAQVATIRRALDGEVGIATGTGDDADVEFLFHPGRILLRTEDVERVQEHFGSSPHYAGRGDLLDEPVPGLALLQLPADAHDGADDAVLRTLDDLDAALGEGLATPDHLLYVTPRGNGDLCPAGEPRVPAGTLPVPARTQATGAGKGVRVAVVDTGWHPPAAAHPLTPWLAAVDGDVEKVDPQDIHEYAGHGTFAAGVVRCQAPAAVVEVEGFLRKGGAAFESDIVKELDETLRNKRTRPQVLSLSAGTHSRKDGGLLAFEKLAVEHRLTERDCGVLVVAAAGNGATDQPFFPAALDWVVGVGSLDRDGTVSDFSNVGASADVFAVGADHVNAFPSGTYTCTEPQSPLGDVRVFDGLAEWSGTSFATPLVVGLVAARMTASGTDDARTAYEGLVAGAKLTQDKRAGSIRVLAP